MKYIDTSALVKYYGNPEFERGVNEITSLIEMAKLGKDVLITSIFTIAEAVSVFDRWIRIRAISGDEFLKVISRFFVDIEELNNAGGLMVESISPLSIVFSIEHIIRHHLSINDSLHLYAALAYKNHIDEFISSDENQLNAAQKEGFKIWNPEESERKEDDDLSKL